MRHSYNVNEHCAPRGGISLASLRAAAAMGAALPFKQPTAYTPVSFSGVHAHHASETTYASAASSLPDKSAFVSVHNDNQSEPSAGPFHVH
ncbi:hypothetical protein MVEN_00018100 [Mycena venus]|uniref:Uncharacterized protein n=1 Tax=Mycena venus TaxID=2733690 RepID=A0A8H6Z785_9AGAR|nr:hypothetical protein MVEN_00018100 [Mycena venus]